MNAEKTKALLIALGTHVPHAQNRAGWLKAHCPLQHWRHDGGKDNDPSFAFRLQPGDARGFCFSCGWAGTISELVLEMRQHNKTQHAVDVKWGEVFAMVDEAHNELDLALDSPDIEEMLFGAKKKAIPFSETWLASFPLWRDVPFARDYVASRDVPEEIADRLDLRADSTEGRVCFPVRDFKGTLMGLHGRAVDPDIVPRYRMYTYSSEEVNHPDIWLGEHWVDLTKPILVVEGPFDVTSALRVYRNTVSPLFVNPSMAKLRRMSPALEWVTLYDRGKGGDAGRAKALKAVGKDHVLHNLIPPEGVKDPGSMTVAQLTEILAPVLPLDPVIS